MQMVIGNPTAREGVAALPYTEFFGIHVRLFIQTKKGRLGSLPLQRFNRLSSAGSPD
jgi:hypothetical protein